MESAVSLLSLSNMLNRNPNYDKYNFDIMILTLYRNWKIHKKSDFVRIIISKLICDYDMKIYETNKISIRLLGWSNKPYFVNSINIAEQEQIKIDFQNYNKLYL